MCAAESCTGGWLSKCCTDLPGSSDWFHGAFVSYSYPAKEQQLGVIHDDLLEHGAVSEEIAQQMALGARRASGADVAVAMTGIAGPGGGLPNKPVGMVCYGWSVRGGGFTAPPKCCRAIGTRCACAPFCTACMACSKHSSA